MRAEGVVLVSLAVVVLAVFIAGAWIGGQLSQALDVVEAIR